MKTSTLSAWLSPAGARARRAALRLEDLEPRDVPATHVWTDNGGSNLWSDAANWTGGAPTTGEAGGTVVQLPLNDLSMYQDVSGLVVDKLEFSNSGSALLTLSKPLGVSGSVALNNVVNDGGTNIIFGAGANELQFVGSSNPFFVVTSGQLTVNAVMSGARSMYLQNSAGVLELDKDNTFTGDVHVTHGTLRLSGPAGGGSTIRAGSQLVVGDGSGTPADSYVELAAGSQLDLTTAITIVADGVLTQTNASNNVIGDVTLVGGQLSAGAGNLAIRDVHATASSTIAAAAGGHVNLLNGAHTITVDAGAVLSVTAPLRNAGAGAVGGITKEGPGELAYKNASLADPNSYTGVTRVNNGVLSLNDGVSDSAFLGDLVIGDGVTGAAVVRLDANFEVPNTIAVTINGDGTLDLHGFNDAIGAVSLAPGGAITTGAGALTLLGDVTAPAAAGAAATITGNVNIGSGVRSVRVDGAANSLVVTGPISGSAEIDVHGPGTTTFAGSFANAYTGATVVIDGTLVLDNDAFNGAVSNTVSLFTTGVAPAVLRLAQGTEIPNSAAVNVNAGTTLNLGTFPDAIGALSLETGGAVAMSGTLTLTADLLVTGTNPTPARVAGGTLNLNGATRVFTVADTIATDDLIVDAGLTNGTLSKQGTGVLILNGTGPTVDVAALAGTVGGTGSLGNLTGGPGTIAPGVDGPGVLNVKNLTFGGGTYSADVNGVAAFDQIQVVGAVDLTGASLAVHPGPGSKLGMTYTVISNDGVDPVDDVFNGLPEGTVFTASGRSFRVSYVGGDGNDVTLTDVTPPTVTGFAVGGAGKATVFNPDGTTRFTAAPFPGYSGAVRVASADFNGDGALDVAVGTGPGAQGTVKVIDGKTQQVIFTATPYDTFTGGVFVAAGDVDGDGASELIVTPDQGGGPRVEVFTGGTFAKQADFFGISDPGFRGGARASAGDLDGDGKADLIVSAGFGGGPRISVYDGAALQAGQLTHPVGDFFAFSDELRNGAYVAAGDLNGDGKADLVFGAGPGGGPRVLLVDGAALYAQGAGAAVASPLGNFFAGNPDNRGGVPVGVADLNLDGKADVLAGVGEGGGSGVTAYLGADVLSPGAPAAHLNLDPFAGFNDGVFVG